MSIIDDHKQHFLVRILSRNSLLAYNTPARSSKLRMNVVTLFEGIQANQVARAGALDRNNPSTARALLASLLASQQCVNTINNISENVSAQFKKVLLSATEQYHLTGRHSFYLGYPFVYSKPPNGGTRTSVTCSPLFLIPVTAKIIRGGIEIQRLVDEDALAPIEVNEILLRRLANDVEKFSCDKQAMLASINNEEIKDVNQLLKLAIEHIQIQDGELQDKNTIGLSPSFEVGAVLKVEALQCLEVNSIFIANHAMLGVVSFRGQNTLNELDDLLKLGNKELEKSVLSKFIFQRENPQEAIFTKPLEENKWLVTASDPSQEAVVWQKSTVPPLIVLQGPPGTGKSQTIVNLIADALAKKQTVAVFCEKPAALQVILKRLSAAGLGDLCQYIRDLTSDRARLINAVKSFNEQARLTFSVAAREQDAKKIVETEFLLDKDCALLQNKQFGKTYAQLKANYQQIVSQKNPQQRIQLDRIKSIYVDQNYPNLDAWEQNWISAVKTLASDIIQYHYIKSPWLAIKNPSLPADAQKLERLLTSLQAFHFKYTHPDAQENLYAPINAWLYESIVLPEWALFNLHPDRRQAVMDYTESRKSCVELTKLLTSDFIVKNSLAIDSLQNPSQTVSQTIASLKTHTPYLETITKITCEINQPKFTGFWQYMQETPQSWEEIARAVAYHSGILKVESQLTAHPLGLENKHRAQITNLMQHLSDKKIKDSKEIFNKYTSTKRCFNNLQGNNLLLIKGGSRNRKTNIRDIYNRGFADITNIYPVLLTSPSIAATILPLTQGLFDLVIIDEASQMFSAEAFSLLHRAKSAIIAGDSKQMPPSNFFGVSGDEDIAEEAEPEAPPAGFIAADGEYVLLDMAERALPAGSPNKCTLQMHYRSASAELIEFSNHAFYEGKLLAAPGNFATQAIFATPIQYTKINGVFDKGINQTEINAVLTVISEVWAREESPSLGVIVFNSVQAAALEDAIIAASEANANFKQHWERERDRLDDGEDVGFFIRSVENVQGDERDIIILATTYAGDSKGYGPLSAKEKGRRRLNVAITRAKQAMLVISSLNIDTREDFLTGDSEGRYLHQYLRYAKAISEQDAATVNTVLNQLNSRRADIQIKQKADDFDSPFEESVATFLREQGYIVESQIGESGFRIDLGVRNQTGIGYLCGIECDGAQYHSGWRARQNDIWRQQILESKGWKIIRVWSTSWFYDLENTCRSLLAAIEAQQQQIQAHQPLRLQSILPAVAEPPLESTLPKKPKRAADEIELKPKSTKQPIIAPIAPAIVEAVDTVEIGDKVHFYFLDEGATQRRSFTIVPEDTPRRANGYLLPNVPLAKAVLGEAVGETVILRVRGNSDRQLIIVAIDKA